MEATVLGIRYLIDGKTDSICLVSGMKVIFTCEVMGYSRPRVIFTQDSMVIEPSLNNRIRKIAFNKVERS